MIFIFVSAKIRIFAQKNKFAWNKMNEIVRFCAGLRPTIDKIDGQALKTANSPSPCQTVFGVKYN